MARRNILVTPRVSAKHLCATVARDLVIICSAALFLVLAPSTRVVVSAQEKAHGASVATWREIEAVVAGSHHTCALLHDDTEATGTVMCWGGNNFGQLGDGTTANQRMVPAQVLNLEISVKAISAGDNHTCVVTASGGVKCWGANYYGQLGDGTRTERLLPVDVAGLTSGVLAIAAGGDHTCAVLAPTGRDTSSVKCWGDNESGQIGDGTTDTRATPVDVIGLSGTAQSLALGAQHSCALADNGTVQCWGSNSYGQLGDGTNNDRYSPVNVIGLGGPVEAITANGRKPWYYGKGGHTCALIVGGQVKCWGGNWHGQLGDGTLENRSVPVNVLGLKGTIRAIAAGLEHTCALRIDTEGTSGVSCWGSNQAGQLGDGNAAASSPPVMVAGLSSAVIGIGAGWQHNCAVWANSLTGSQGLECWGTNVLGELGSYTVLSQAQPVLVGSLRSSVYTVSTGQASNCALTTGSPESGTHTWCWGGNNSGMLGDGSETSRIRPVQIPSLTGKVLTVDIGTEHACAILSDATDAQGLPAAGELMCWGSNSHGQLGDGTTSSRPSPQHVIGLANDTQSVVVGGWHTCALTATGGVKCWGDNRWGQLGDGTTTDHSSPADVIGLETGVKALAAGVNYTCALMSFGDVKCWGATLGGVGGASTLHYQVVPVDVQGLDDGVQALSSRYTHLCALTVHGAVKCWGDNQWGQLGDGTTIDHAAPVSVSGLSGSVMAVSAGYRHTCALTTNGTLACWGNNSSYQLGDGTMEDRLTPVTVQGGIGRIVAVSAGGLHTCAVVATGAASGNLFCWGDNMSAQLGANPGWLPVFVLLSPGEVYLPYIVVY